MYGTHKNETDFHCDWLARQIERLEERNKRGATTTDIPTSELQYLFRELLSMHQRCNRLEEMLAEFAMYNTPPKIVVGANTGTKAK